MNNSRYLSLVFFLLLAIAKSEEPYNEGNPSAFDLKIVQMVSDGGFPVNWVTPQNIDAVVRRIKLVRSMPSFAYLSRNCSIALVKLGDEETIAQATEDFRDLKPKLDQWGGEALHQATVVALPHLINDLYMADPKRRRGGEVEGPSPRDRMTALLLGIISRSKELPSETRQWSQSFRETGWLRDLEKLDNLASTVETWWERNEKAIMARNYAEAKWLPPRRDDREGTMPDPDDARPVLPRKTETGKTPPKELDGAIKPAPLPQVAYAGDYAPLPGDWTLWAGNAGILVATAGWLLMRGRQSRPGR
jgi:hypothetical protein